MGSHAQALARSGELDAMLEARGFGYGLLAQAFMAEPSPGLVQSLAASGVVRLFPYAEHPGLIQQGVEEVAAYVLDPGSVTIEAYDKLLWDYTRMFIGPLSPPAPPFESAYRTDGRLLFQAETLDVRQAYRAYGLASAKLGSEPDDQMGLELQFLSETCRVAAERAAEGDEAGLDQVLRDQGKFLDEHLLRWAEAFAGDVAANAEVGFYRGMAHLLAGFVPLDRRLLDELLAETAGSV